ncbi:thioredoxin domain-containing protein [Kitasatospora sp. NBC_00070]
MVNRLNHTQSPYLQQHATDPMEEEMAEAARRDAPILLSVDYAACHRCQ